LGGTGDDATEAERILATARQFVEQSDLRGSWFELGGSSMGAAQFVSRLRKQGTRVTLAQLLRATSVHELLADLAAQAPRTPS
jgi:aryl carrier-like protein